MTDARRRPSELKAGAILSYVYIAVQFGVTIAFTPIMLRLLGQSEFGLYSLVLSVVGYLNLLSFGFGGAYIRFYARFHFVEDWNGVERLNGMFLVLFTGLALIAGLVGTLITINVESVVGSQFSAGEIATIESLFIVLIVNFVITLLSSVFISFIIAHERFLFQKLVQILKALLTPLVTLPVLFLGYESIGMAVVLTSVNLILAIYTVMYCCVKLKMKFKFRGLEFPLFREVSVFSSYLFINMIVDQVNWNVDKLLVGRFHGAAPVAVYGVAALLNTSYLMFSTAISSVFIPRINRMVESGVPLKELNSLFQRVGRIQFLVLGLVVSWFILFGKYFIEVWAGVDYSDAYYIALFLLVPVTIPLVQNLGIEIQKAKNLHQFRSWLYLGIAVFNVLLSIPLTQKFGGIGAAAATALALVIGNGFIMNWYYKSRVGLDIGRFWVLILNFSRGIIPALIGGLVMVQLVNIQGVVSLIVLSGLYALIYALGMWWIGMNNYEKDLIISPIGKILDRGR